MLDFDFTQFHNEAFKKECKEDFVREFIIAPLLQALGFKPKGTKEAHLEIMLSKTLIAPATPTILGSNKNIEAQDILIPDYMLYVDSMPHCVLDAKAPSVSLSAQSKAERQAFYYAINKEIKAPYYALCNGLEFALFETHKQELLCAFACEDIFKNNGNNADFALLRQYLTTPIESLRQVIGQNLKQVKKPDSWYLERKIPRGIKKPKKRAKARHFGCTGYFTKQSWDIVTQNIKAFTDEGDIVLDPFGGSGVTAIESMMNNRVGIHTDLNPLSIFMTKALSTDCDLDLLRLLSSEILEEFESMRPKNEKEAQKILKNASYYPNAIDSEFGLIATQKMQDSTLWIPQDEALPKGSDVDSVLQLFSKTQLAELALLRKLIFKKTTPSGNKKSRNKKRGLRYALMLAFYSVISDINLTYHKSYTGGGNSGIFRYYRYRIAKEPTIKWTAKTFQQKIERVVIGKKELKDSPYFYASYFHAIDGVIKDFSGAMLSQRQNLEQIDSIESKTNGEKFFQADATDLKEIESQSIDFIYTDPPYGDKIPYLDLSTMWNVWLDLPVDRALKEKECIEKGSLEKTRYDYYDLMKQSLKEMYRVLKFNRWLAFVFQHQDPKLFQILVESAENLGFEYMGFVSQEDTGVASFKKVQNPTRVLKGQLILYFRKVDNPKTRLKLEAGVQSLEQMYRDIESIIVKNNGATLETINANLVKMALEGGYHTLMMQFQNVIDLINERFDYDNENSKYHIRDEASILNHGISIEEKARYIIVGELHKAHKEKRGIAFDALCLYILPLLKNGVQVNNRLIKEILNELAYERDGLWYVKDKEPTLFD